MTLKDMREMVLDALRERTSSRGLIPDVTSLNRWVNQANRWAWKKGVERNPDHWLERSDDLDYLPADGKYDLSSSGVEVYKPSWIAIVDPSAQPGGQRFIDWTEPQNRPIHETSGRPAPANELPRSAYIEGASIFFTPPPSTGFKFRFGYVPKLEDMASDDEALGERFPEHHDLVVWKTCQLLSRKAEKDKTPWDNEVGEALGDFIRALRRSQQQKTRRVRPASHYGRS